MQHVAPLQRALAPLLVLALARSASGAEADLEVTPGEALVGAVAEGRAGWSGWLW